jgi:hypothetical protein
MSERVFYPDTNDVSSTSKVVARCIAVFRFNASTLQRSPTILSASTLQRFQYKRRIKREAKLAV